MNEKTAEEGIKLGENIQLAGFKELDPGTMVIVRKMVGNHVKKIQDDYKDFRYLKLSLKKVHQREHAEIYELHADLHLAKIYAAKKEDRNLFVALDEVLKAIDVQLKRY